ncbi:beta strand repeat-containing protein [Kaistella sp.]|uniref:beta strand repeat-containing protein n=1 Tax=Kaistella sp. TaxID=2782235 RepID=UPI002F93DE01
MKKKLFPGFQYLVALCLMLISAAGWGQVAAWNPTTPISITNYGPSPFAATTLNANLSSVGLTRGAGMGTVNTAAGSAWGGTMNTANVSTASAAITANQFFTFSVTANTGYEVSLSTFDLFYRRSSTGPSTGGLQYAINGGAFQNIATLSFASTNSSGAAITQVNLSGITALQNVPSNSTINFRILLYGNGTVNGPFYIFSTGLRLGGAVTNVSSNYTITYSGNGNSGGLAPIDPDSPYTPGSNVTVLDNTGVLTKDCASFSGWNSAADGNGTQYFPGDIFNINTNTILYARWFSTSKTVNFNANGGTGTMTLQTACAPEAIKNNAYSRTGYTFAGWNTAANGSGTAYNNGALYDFTADVTLYAQWTPNNNTITFDKNAADATGSTPAQTLATGTNANLNTNGYSRTGYTFAGWATSASGIVVYADQASYTMGTGNVTLFAKWTANTYQVIFNKNHADATGTMSNQQIAYQTTSNLTSNAFARTGYAFKEWNTAADGSGTRYANSAAYTMSTLGDKTLYAQWEVYTGPCLSEDFTAGTNPAGWINSGTGITFGSYYADIAANTGYITMASVSNPKTLTFDLSRTSNATVKNLNIEVSTTSQTSGFTVIANYDHNNTTSNGTTAVTVDLSAYSAASTIYIRFNKTSGSTSPWRIDNIQVFCGSSVPAPQISVTPAGNYGFGNQLVSSSSPPANFTITNTGTLDLTLGAISLSGSHADQFSITQPGVLSLAPGATTTFTATFAPTSTGAKTATVTIPNNTGTPYAFNITGTGALNAVPNNGLNLNTGACIANNQMKLNWTAASGGATGYIVYALAGATAPAIAAASAGNAISYTANSDFSAATSYGSLGKAVYKGSGTTATITGLTQGQQYTFKVVAYNGETATGWSSSINSTSGTSIASYTIKVPEVGNPAATVAPTSSVVSWNVIPESAGCYEYLVVASQGAVTFTPSGNGSAYTANPVFSGNNQVVYMGTGITVSVTGLTEGLQYCYKIFVREVNSSQWSEGVSFSGLQG